MTQQPTLGHGWLEKVLSRLRTALQFSGSALVVVLLLTRAFGQWPIQSHSYFVVALLAVLGIVVLSNRSVTGAISKQVAGRLTSRQRFVVLLAALVVVLAAWISVIVLLILNTAKAQPPGEMGPDLEVREITCSPRPAHVGEKVWCTVTLVNTGTDAIRDTFNVAWYLDAVDGKGNLSLDDRNRFGYGNFPRSLQPGETASGQGSNIRWYFVPSTPGKHKVTFYADVDGVVPELSEDNNWLTVCIQVE